MRNYFDIINEAIDLVVVTDEHTNKSYLEPRYRELLRESDIHLDNDPDNVELYEALELEVKKRNAVNDKAFALIDWIYDIVNTVADPAVTQENNELMKNMLEYMELKNKLQDKEKELDIKEKSIDVKQNISKMIIEGLDLSKRDPKY